MSQKTPQQNPTTIAIRRAAADDCASIRSIAERTWPDTYGHILPPGQLEYMLDKSYSDAALQQQMAEGHAFFIAFDSRKGELVGFVSVSRPEPQLFIIEKLYVLPEFHGSGAGRRLTEFAEKYIVGQTAERPVVIELNVNRENKAAEFYRHIGFAIDREVDEEIGNGYFKNDYIMRKILSVDDARTDENQN